MRRSWPTARPAAPASKPPPTTSSSFTDASPAASGTVPTNGCACTSPAAVDLPRTFKQDAPLRPRFAWPMSSLSGARQFWCAPRKVRRPQGSGRRRAGNRETAVSGHLRGLAWLHMAGSCPRVRVGPCGGRGAAAARGRRPPPHSGASSRGRSQGPGQAAPGHSRRTR